MGRVGRVMRLGTDPGMRFLASSKADWKKTCAAKAPKRCARLNLMAMLSADWLWERGKRRCLACLILRPISCPRTNRAI